MSVFVLDRSSLPLMPCSEKRARKLLAAGRARVQTGDLVRADVPATSKKAGVYLGRVAVRASGSFNIQTGSEVVQGISHKHCRIIQRSDGYGYARIAT